MADSLRQAREANGTPAFWEAQVSALLAQVDSIEKEFLPNRKPTCHLRRVGKRVVDRAASDPHFRGICRRLKVLDG